MSKLVTPERGAKVRAARDIDRYPFYELIEGTPGTVVNGNDHQIIVTIELEGDTRLAGSLTIIYATSGPYDELTLPYEQWWGDWFAVSGTVGRNVLRNEIARYEHKKKSLNEQIQTLHDELREVDREIAYLKRYL